MIPSSSPPSPSELANQAERGLFSRWSRTWAALALLMLAIGLGFCWTDPKVDWPARLLALGLVVVWGGWYGLFILGARRWKRDGWALTLSFVFAIEVATVLAFIHPAFLMILFSYYGVSFGSLPLRRAIAIVALLSVSLAARFIAFSGGLSRDSLPIIASFGLSAFFAVLLGAWVDSIIRQSRDRQRMLEELEAARSELAAAERQAGVLEERQRLAGEIHDTLAQGFTSIVLHLEAAEQALPPPPKASVPDELEAARQHIATARATARDSLGEARRFVWALKPEVLERKPLAEALGEVARRWSAASGTPAGLTLTGSPRPLPPATEVILLRAAQEALTNIHKHACAAHASLTLSYMEDQVILDVHDDGQGFEPSARGPAGAEGGFGLPAMRQRVEQLGGSLLLESAPGEGTTVTIMLPMEEN